MNSKIILTLSVFGWFAIFLCNCGGGGGSKHSVDPDISKYQDARIDSPQDILSNITAKSPKVAISTDSYTKSSRIFIAWLDQRNGESNVYFNCRNWDGTWLYSSDRRIDVGLQDGMFAEELSLVTSTDGKIIHIVWADRRSNYEAIWYNNSQDGGSTFQSKAICISPNWPACYPSSQPRICCSNDGLTVHIAYRYGLSDIVRRSSTDGGLQWEEPIDSNFFVSAVNRGMYLAKNPSIACSDDGSYCHITWQGGYFDDGTNLKNYIWHRCWNQTKRGWVISEEKDVSQIVAWHSYPQIACTSDGQSAYIVWRISGYIDPNIVSFISFSYTSDLGQNFSAPGAITNSAQDFIPKLYLNRTDNELCVIWENFVLAGNSTSGIDEWTVQSRKRFSDGSWTVAITNLSEVATKNNKPFVLPDIAGNGKNVIVVWSDFAFLPQTIYMNQSSNTGETWTYPTGQVVSQPSANAKCQTNWPTVAINELGEIYIAWAEKRNSNIYKIFGRDMSNSTTLEETPTHQTEQRPHNWEPKLAAKGINLYAIWQSNRNGGQDLYSANSNDYGNSWNKDAIVNQSPGEICSNHQISMDSNYTYFLWEKSYTANSGIIQVPGHYFGEEIKQVVFQRYYHRNNANELSKKTDVTFEFNPQNNKLYKNSFQLKKHLQSLTTRLYPIANLTTSGFSQECRDAIDLDENANNALLTHNNNGVLYAFYSNSEDYSYTQVRRYISTNLGETWSKKNNYHYIDASGTGTLYPVEFIQSQILAETNMLYWIGQIRGCLSNTRSDIIFMRHINYIANNEPEVKVRLDQGDAPYSNESSHPQMVKSGNMILAAWTDFRNGTKPDIYFNYSLDNGVTWKDTALELSNDSGDLYINSHVKLAAYQDRFYAVWSEYHPNENYFSIQTNTIQLDSEKNIKIISTPIRIEDRSVYSLHPQIICNNGKVYIVWEGNYYGNRDILVTSSSNYGKTWSVPKRYNTQSIKCQNPQIAISQNWIHVIWEDFRYGKNIFFETRK